MPKQSAYSPKNLLSFTPANSLPHTVPHTPPSDSDTPSLPGSASLPALNMPSPSPHMLLSSKD